MPSSSARCAQLPRAVDKVPFYLALKKLRDYIRGDLEHLDDADVTFPTLDMKMKSEIKFDKDEESNECLSELTLEQIQTRSEYLEALAASAEGREIPAEKMARRRNRGGGSDDEDNTLNFEDEESSQSSCSSELQRASQSDLSSQGSYTLSKSLPGSSSFEVIPDAKEEPPLDPYDYGSNSHSPETQEREDQNSNSRSSPAVSSKSSPQPFQQPQVSSPAIAASSPGQVYNNYSPPTSTVNFCSSTSVTVGGHSPMGTWPQNSTQTYPTGEISNEGVPRHPVGFMPTTNPPHPPPLHYHMHSATSPYHQGGAPMPVPTPMHPVNHCPGQFKGRPPRHQWSNGSSNHMLLAPTVPAGGTYPYMYSRGSCAPCLPYQGSGVHKAGPSMSTQSSQRNSMDKNGKGGASYPPSHVPNFFTC